MVTETWLNTRQPMGLETYNIVTTPPAKNQGVAIYIKKSLSNHIQMLQEPFWNPKVIALKIHFAADSAWPGKSVIIVGAYIIPSEKVDCITHLDFFMINLKKANPHKHIFLMGDFNMTPEEAETLSEKLGVYVNKPMRPEGYHTRKLGGH